jgi:hypothetical protein
VALQKTHPSDPNDNTKQNSHAVAAVNYGLILFLQQQQATAQAVLEPLFEDVDLLQDGTALCLCVLLLELYLDSCQLPKAVQILQYLQGLAPPAGLPGSPGSSPAAATGETCSNAGSSQGQLSAGAGSSASAKSPRHQPQPQQHEAVHKDSSTEAGRDGEGDLPAGQVDGVDAGGEQQQQQQQQPQQQQVSAGCLSETLPVLSKTKGQCMQQVSDQGTTLHYCIPIFCLASITLCVVWLLSPYACQCLHLELRWSAHHGLHKDSRGSE